MLNAWTTGHYSDAHCSVFTPESAAALLAEVVELGILNVAVSAPQQYEDEFYIHSPSWVIPRSLIPIQEHRERQSVTRSFHVARALSR